jgi:sulfur relay (sulfurtransferase) DsrC/TusE family protein
MNMIEDRDAFTHEEQEWNEDSLKKIAKALNVELKPPPRDF